MPYSVVAAAGAAATQAGCMGFFKLRVRAASSLHAVADPFHAFVTTQAEGCRPPPSPTCSNLKTRRGANELGFWGVLLSLPVVVCVG